MTDDAFRWIDDLRRATLAPTFGLDRGVLAELDVMRRLQDSMKALQTPTAAETNLAEAMQKSAEAFRQVAYPFEAMKSLAWSLNEASDLGRRQSEALASIETLLRRQPGIDAFTEATKAQAESIRRLSESLDFSVQLGASITAMQSLVTCVDFDLAKKLAPPSAAFFESMKVGLSSVTESYGSLLSSVVAIPTAATSFPSLLLRSATQEVYREATVARAIAPSANVGTSKSTDDVEDEAPVAQLESFDPRETIGAFDTTLLRLVDGAREALWSENPDRGRHAASSVRELFTNVLHRLAPDAGVDAWGGKVKENYHDGK